MTVLIPSPRRLRGWAAMVLAIALPCLSQATVFCVNTSSGLVDALLSAAASGEDDEIRLMFGTYTVPDPDGFIYQSSTTGGLAISGGWGPPSQDKPVCDSRKDNPNITVLDGQFAHQGLVVEAGSETGDIVIENMTIRQGRTATRGGGLSIPSFAPATSASLSIRSMVMVDNESDIEAAGLLVNLVSGHLLLDNSVLFGNAAGVQSAAASLVLNGESATIANLSIVGQNNGTADRAALRIEGTTPTLLINTVFHDNTDADLELAHAEVSLLGNFINQHIGDPPLLEDGTLSGNPTLGTGTYGLGPFIGSVLIDSGFQTPQVLPTRDADGNIRLIGEIDRGAYEAQIYADGVEGDDDWIVPTKD